MNTIKAEDILFTFEENEDEGKTHFIAHATGYRIGDEDDDDWVEVNLMYAKGFQEFNKKHNPKNDLKESKRIAKLFEEAFKIWVGLNLIAEGIDAEKEHPHLFEISESWKVDSFEELPQFNQDLFISMKKACDELDEKYRFPENKVLEDSLKKHVPALRQGKEKL